MAWLRSLPTGRTSGRQRGYDPALCNLYPHFGLGFVAGFVGPCRNHCKPVMCGQLAVGGVQFRLVPARMLDAGLGAVWDRHLRYASKELQRADVGADPAGKILAPGGFREGVAAGASTRPRTAKLENPRRRSWDRKMGILSPSIIDEQFFSGAVFVAQNHIQLARPAAIQLTEVAVTVAVLVIFA